jgi:hydrogenase nickel incorporation protein HypA/HybF
MHELSIATDLVNAATATAKENHANKVLSVRVDIGELAIVNPEQLKFMYEIITEETILKGSNLEMNMVPADTVCRCGYRGGIEDKFTCACPVCGMTLQILKGKDVVVTSIEIDV